MQTLLKNLLSGAGGAIVTGGLTLAMVAMIKVEFQAQSHEAIEIASINPVDIDVEPPAITVDPPELEEVDVPPPPPKVKTITAGLPVEPIAAGVDIIPPFKPKGIDIVPVTFTVMEQEEDCLVCIAPIMPVRAERSGHCKLRMDISPDGTPFNVTAEYCTQTVFKRNSIKAAQQFKYRPRITNGQAIVKTGVTTTITFVLKDENGRVIPE